MVSYQFLFCIVVNLIGSARVYSQAPFQLKLYWEDGYHWQNESEERKYCAQCSKTKCLEGDILYIRKCDERNIRQRFISNNVTNTIQPMMNQGLCLSRSNARKVLLVACPNPTESVPPKQTWDAINSGEKKIEFSYYIGGEKKCLSQHHCPKLFEKMKMITCDLAQNTDTSNWERIDLS